MALRPSGIYDVDYVQDLAIFRTRTDWFWFMVILAVLFFLPQFTSTGLLGDGLGASWVSLTFLNILTTGGILLISTTGLNILLGFTGQISLGQAAFMMCGAYASTVFTAQSDLPFIIALPLATLITGLVGLVFGLASLRVKGFYLAMATLAAQFLIPWALSEYKGADFKDVPLIGGVMEDIVLGDLLRVPNASFLGIEFNTRVEKYYLVLIFVVIMATLARNLMRSRVGRAWISIRDNELAAEQLGINIFRYKVLSFFVCALYAGVAGSLKAHVDGSVSEETFGINYSIELLAMLVIGGAGFHLGPTFGVGFFLFVDRTVVDFFEEIFIDFLPRLLDTFEPLNIQGGLPLVLFGSLLAIFLIYEPRGIAYRWRIIQAAWRLRPFSKV